MRILHIILIADLIVRAAMDSNEVISIKLVKCTETAMTPALRPSELSSHE